MKKTIASAVVIALLAFLGWRAWTATRTEEEPKPPPSRPPVSVELAEVRREAIREEQQLTGEVLPGYRYVVAPRVPGRVVEITKRIGDPVSEGEAVARIDDAEYRQAILESEADLKIARASLEELKVQLELAGQELERIRALEAKKIASRAELDRAQAERDGLEIRLKLVQAQLEQREASRATAGIKLGYTILTAARPGLVGERFVDEGALLSANAPVLSVIGIDPAIVRTTVVERLYGRLRAGQTVGVEVDAHPGRRFEGRVARIAPQLREDSRTAEMEVEVRNPALLLKPGMFTRVTVVLSENPAAQVVPPAAVITRNGETGVFVVLGGEAVARWVPVRVGIVTPAAAEVVSPLLDGPVVTLGQHLLEEGSPVVVPAAGGGA